ncbi:hypothetical protein HYS31_03075 [Candidatus Woesearchaeota archaeon]|nr:hypothetical protein [Candidatus Woesearchaeota archaeon]
MTDISQLERTVLFPVYQEFMQPGKGKLGEFGGHLMPIQFSHPFEEHLAARRTAAWWDISHMLRVMIKGKDALDFLRKYLTNDAASLNDFGEDFGMAQYTGLPDGKGHLKDDAFLYRLEDIFIFVGNASNRKKDFDYLSKSLEEYKTAALTPVNFGFLPESVRDKLVSFERRLLSKFYKGKLPDVELENISKRVAMLSLQGPNAESILEDILSRDGNSGWLPKAKKNYLSKVKIGDYQLIISRTGYTGENVGFEIFLNSEFAPQFSRELAEAGKPYGLMAAGLAARDSTRLEAGFPLYGHEQGDGTNGSPTINTFAIDQARFGVNLLDPKRSFPGREYLERQRKEYEAIERGELIDPSSILLSKHIKPLLGVGSSGRSLRAGMKLHYKGKEVGAITSGLYSPYTHFDGEGVYAVPADEWSKRTIGMGLINSDLRFNPQKEIVFQVFDENGKEVKGLEAKLVDSNMISAYPYSRPQDGTIPEPQLVEPFQGSLEQFAIALTNDGVVNTQSRKFDCFNCIASEQSTSDIVGAFTGLDPKHRYNEIMFLRAIRQVMAFYEGTQFMNVGLPDGELHAGIEPLLNAELRRYFNARTVGHSPNSGQQAVKMVVGGIMDYTNRSIAGDPPRLWHVLNVGQGHGGHISIQSMYGLKDFVQKDRTGRYAVSNLPMRRDSPYEIDTDAAINMLKRVDPERRGGILISVGRSCIRKPEPLERLRIGIDDYYGKDNPDKAILNLDDSHTNGLYKFFHADALQFVDTMEGSLHKVFFGPQGAAFWATNRPFNDELVQKIYGRVLAEESNTHLHVKLALLYATREMNEFWQPYGSQVIKNAQFVEKNAGLAGLIAEPGLTQSHIALLRGERYQGHKMARTLRENNTVTSAQALYDDMAFLGASGLRIGTQEMTRFGMKEEHFGELLTYMGRALRGQNVAKQVASFKKQFTTMLYCLPEEISQPIVRKIQNAYKLAA